MLEDTKPNLDDTRWCLKFPNQWSWPLLLSSLKCSLDYLKWSKLIFILEWLEKIFNKFIYEGLMFRCMMFLEWRYSRPLKAWYIHLNISLSKNVSFNSFFWLINLATAPFYFKSIIKKLNEIYLLLKKKEQTSLSSEIMHV